MFHKIKNVYPLPNNKLTVQFSEGVTKLYDITPLICSIPAFQHFLEHPEDFYTVTVDIGGCGIVWNDALDLSSDELWENGIAPHPS